MAFTGTADDPSRGYVSPWDRATQDQYPAFEGWNSIAEELLKDEDITKEKLQWEIEKMIRSYDPCMSCASHFLKLNIEGVDLKSEKV